MFINYEHDNNVYNIIVERRDNRFFITYGNSEYKVQAEEVELGHLKIKLGDRIIKSVITEGEEKKYVFVEGDVFNVKKVELTSSKKTRKKEEDILDSPISGRVVSVNVKNGNKVKKGDVLLVIESMKMEYLIRAPFDGIIEKIYFKEKDQVEIGKKTLELKKRVEE